MVAWGIERCEKENVPAYLESTLEAVHLYKETGFESLFDISMQVSYDSENAGVITEIYKETAMVYRPTVTKDDENDL